MNNTHQLCGGESHYWGDFSLARLERACPVLGDTWYDARPSGKADRGDAGPGAFGSQTVKRLVAAPTDGRSDRSAPRSCQPFASAFLQEAAGSPLFPEDLRLLGVASLSIGTALGPCGGGWQLLRGHPEASGIWAESVLLAALEFSVVAALCF